MKDNAIIIVDAGNGDAGKGSIIDYLARLTNASTVIRYNGAAQAAHNVVTADGKHHTFSQFGSATFVPGVKTHLSKYMLIHPFAMMNEERHLRTQKVFDAFQRTTIDAQAVLISPYQQAANRLFEIHRAEGRHGSCGLGVGITKADSISHPDIVLYAEDVFDKTTLRRKFQKLEELQYEKIKSFAHGLPKTGQVLDALEIFGNPEDLEWFLDQFEMFARVAKVIRPEHTADMLKQTGTVLFEAAQGLLLDQWHGFYPHNSWSNLTTENAIEILDDFEGRITTLALTRVHSTRHGAGPFVTEDKLLTEKNPELHNDNNMWQREFKVGPADLVTLQYAASCVKNFDGLVVTHLDCMTPEAWKICEAYRYAGKDSEVLDPFFYHDDEKITGIKVLTPKGDPSFPDQNELQILEERTRLLSKCRPVYRELSDTGNPIDFARAISNSLDIPLAITSQGPTAEDKKTEPFFI